MPKLYKIVGPDGSACHGGNGNWRLPTRGKPGKWMPAISEVVPCKSGYHLLTAGRILEWLKLDCVLYEAEATGKRITEDDKIVVSRARLTRRVGTLTHKLLVNFAADCVERGLPRWERMHPKDDRPRKAIEAARAWAMESTEKNRAAAYDAARTAHAATNAAADAAARTAHAAAYVADAAAYAAYVAAYAAYDAAHAAANAAYAAAADAAAYDATHTAYAAASVAERRWQARHLLKLLRSA